MAKLLIADRDLKVRSAMEAFLHNLGFTVYGTDNTDDLIKITKRENPDVVVLDVRIGPNGELELDVIDKIKEINKRIKVVVTSVYSESDPEWHQIKALAIDKYYTNPFVFQDFVSELKAMTAKLLFADEIEESNDMYKDLFESKGFACLTAVGSEGILSAVEKERPDIVCLDIKIRGPLASGEVLKKIRQIDPKIKVIMLTVFPPEETMERLKKYGVMPDGYIEKPMDFKDFEEEVRRVIRTW